MVFIRLPATVSNRLNAKIHGSPNSHRKPRRNVLRVFDVCKKRKAVVKIILDL